MGLIKKVKLNTSAVSEAKTNAAASFDTAYDLKTETDAMFELANNHCNHWKYNIDGLARNHTTAVNLCNFTKEVTHSDGTVTTEEDVDAWRQKRAEAREAARKWVENKIAAYSSALNNFPKYVDEVKANIMKMKNCAEKINEAIDTFEANEISDADYNNAVYCYNSLASNLNSLTGISAKMDTLDNVKAKGGKTVVDGKDVGEGAMEGYAYTTTTAATAVGVAALGHYRGYSAEEIEEAQHRQVDYNYGKTQWAQEKGFFDTNGKTKEKVKEIYESTFNEPYTERNVKERLDKMRQQSSLTPEEMEFLGGYLGAGTAPGTVSSFDSVLINIERATNPSYTPFAGETSEPVATPVSNTPSAGSGCGSRGGCGGYGGYSGGGSSGGSATPASLVAQTTSMGTGKSYSVAEHMAMPKPTVANITSVASQSVPAPIQKDNAKYIDQQASEIFYGKNPDQIAADRANALSVVDKAFAGEGVEEFKDVLKQGGFDDVDIDIIMDNKEIAVTAYILATESKSLTDIANQLAVANNIANFDTMYDNGLSRMSLENGLSQSKLMAQVDQEVQDARTNVQNARNKYNNSVKKANDSIEEANKKKEEMEELKKRIVKKSGEDPSKWEDEDVEAYNKAIEKYNEANRDANEAHQEAMSHKKVLDEAEAKLQKTEEKVANEYLEQYNANQQAEPEQLEMTGESVSGEQGNQEVPTGNVANNQETLSTDNLISDQNGNIEVQTQENQWVSPGEEVQEPANQQLSVEGTDAGVQSSGAGSNTSHVAQNLDNVEVERKLTSDDLIDLFDNIEDVANVSSQERTLDAVDLSSLSPDERTIPNLGVNGGMEEVNNVPSGDRVLDPTDLGNLDMSDRQINPTDLGNISDVDDRIIPNLEVNNSFDNLSGMSEVAREIAPQASTSGGNGLVGFANSAGQTATDNTKSFQDYKTNGMSGFSINAGSMNALESDTSYASNSVGEKKDESSSSSQVPEPPKEERETIAGVQVESSDVEKHTDGVLVESDGQVASEVSEDGRSLEYIEID